MEARWLADPDDPVRHWPAIYCAWSARWGSTPSEARPASPCFGAEYTMSKLLANAFFKNRKSSRLPARKKPRLEIETLEVRLVPAVPRPDHVVLVMEENH